jgi:hypothetical protein
MGGPNWRRRMRLSSDRSDPNKELLQLGLGKARMKLRPRGTSRTNVSLIPATPLRGDVTAFAASRPR